MVTVRHRGTLPSDAEQWPRGREFSICTNTGENFLFYPIHGRLSCSALETQTELSNFKKNDSDNYVLFFGSFFR